MWSRFSSIYYIQTELLDVYTNGSATVEPIAHGPTDEVEQSEIGFRNAHFTWSSQVDSTTPSRREFTLQADGDITFETGSLNLIVGPTASGKTSLLLALLGELHYVPIGLDSWYNLPRDGGVSYCAQEPWILNETIRVGFLMIAYHSGPRSLIAQISGKYSVWPTVRRGEI